jgi:DNA-binding beta-propeller fold protein YncE
MSYDDMASNTITTNVNVGNSPNGIAVSPDGTKAHAANEGSNSVSVIL